MKLSVPALAPLLPLLAGCVINLPTLDEGDDEADGGDGDGDSSTGTDDTTSTDDATTTTSTDDEIGTETDTSSETDGPPEEFCGLSEGPDEPWFALDQYGNPLMSGGNLELECGGQGSFMFRFDASLGGFLPEDEVVPFHAVLDVEGYNIGPNGHFAEDDFNIFVGCCDDEDPYDYNYYCYYGSYFTFFPPDAIDDLSVLHQLPATLTVTMTTPQGPVEQSLEVLLWAMDDGNWEFCEYGYYDAQPLPLSELPIPTE